MYMYILFIDNLHDHLGQSHSLMYVYMYECTLFCLIRPSAVSEVQQEREHQGAESQGQATQGQATPTTTTTNPTVSDVE